MGRDQSDVSDHLRTKLNENYPLGLISRKNIGIATGGILHPRTMGNLDSQQTGISDPIHIGRQVYYHVDSVVDFIEAKISSRNDQKAI